MIIAEDEQLEHFGVKGMRWGVRKSREEGGAENANSASNKKKAVAVAATLALGVVVVAALLARNGHKKFESMWGQTVVASPHAFASATPAKRAEMVYDSLGKYPNGARGELGVGWTLGGGHSVAWEVVNNKPVIFDTQSSKTYKSPKDFEEFTPILHEAAHTRLDTVTINDQFIRRWVTDAA